MVGPDPGGQRTDRDTDTLTLTSLSYSDVPPLIGRLGGEVSLVSVGSFDSQETVGGVSDPTGQHSVSQHGVDHSALPVTGPESQTDSVILYTDTDQTNVLQMLRKIM